MVSGQVLKLSDFGLAVQLAPNALLTDKCGTPAFMPETQRAKGVFLVILRLTGVAT